MKPKATAHRTTEMITRFASLPSSSASLSDNGAQLPRAILGIDISAVHSAVLSGGVTRIPGKLSLVCNRIVRL